MKFVCTNTRLLRTTVCDVIDYGLFRCVCVPVCNYSGLYPAVYSIITSNGAGKSLCVCVFLLMARLKKIG